MTDETAFLSAFRTAVDSPTANWVEWVHVQKGKTHCETCLKLDNCWFMDSQKPTLPQHPYCHCQAEPLPYSRVASEAKADSDIRKFSEYAFIPREINDKSHLFTGWGYTVKDSDWLKTEFIKQAKDKYIAGEYTLHKLNKEGQQITIRVEIPDKSNGKATSFLTGWMVYPDGRIQLTTPFGGF